MLHQASLAIAMLNFFSEILRIMNAKNCHAGTMLDIRIRQN